MKTKIVFLLALVCSFTVQAQVSPTTNSISLDISTAPQNAGFTYDSCFAIGEEIGIGSVGMFQNWTNIETAPGLFNLFLFDIANFYYPANGMPIDLTIAPIATNQLEVPSFRLHRGIDPSCWRRHRCKFPTYRRHLCLDDQSFEIRRIQMRKRCLLIVRTQDARRHR